MQGLAAVLRTALKQTEFSHIRPLSAIGPQAVKGYSSSEAQEYGMGQKVGRMYRMQSMICSAGD